ncbi:MAG TPA: hypothetical protein VE569_10165 [Acidimicrobiia bacterium]|jgi:hypothetical protein|nr:hypothetical protein [Acidimicrobiia bacterium]
MRRLVPLVIILTMVPATAVWGTELGDILRRGQEATYSAEQTISCSTPDGVRDAIVRINQNGGELRVSASVTDDVEVAAGSGRWSMRRDGGTVATASVGAGAKETTKPLYTLTEEQAVEYLGRAAMSYLLIRHGEPRGKLTIDNETGALVEAVTFTIDREIYCERRFISLNTDVRQTESLATDAEAPSQGTPPAAVAVTNLPVQVAGFELLDQYEDEDGLRFAYYSDGFFSFAVFETPSVVELPEATTVDFDTGMYLRVFTAGQVTYVWETNSGGMALVGDLPPDLHEEVLSALPHPDTPGFFVRWWHSLFG